MVRIVGRFIAGSSVISMPYVLWDPIKTMGESEPLAAVLIVIMCIGFAAQSALYAMTGEDR